MISLRQFTADHLYLRDCAARQAKLRDPLLVQADYYSRPLISAATQLETLPIDGVLLMSWRRWHRDVSEEVELGMRIYEIEQIRFAVVDFHFDDQFPLGVMSFLIVARADYARLRALALRVKPRTEQEPILAAGQAELLWENTIGYLDPANLERIERYGGRAHRGVLLTGSPGNGKTMACRWICDACRERGWEWRIVTPDQYRQARQEAEVDDLFSMAERGVIFFDDMDQALRCREESFGTEDQSVFLTALDGMRSKHGVVFVFTTNCGLEMIDRAFKRPGRIDVVLPFREPDADMRRRLIRTWHSEIREQLDEQAMVASTDGYSFAELEEIKNLLVMNRVDRGTWDWSWAIEQFTANRNELSARRPAIGFSEARAKPR